MSLISPATFADLRRMSGDELINEVIDAFLDDAPKMIAAMQTALRTRDVESFRRNAHSMKSNADTFGATALAALARELEAMGRAGDLNVGNRVDVLRTACDAVSSELEGMRI
jgi:HPt (histidine-containing phosphotransfer) domain-containing protein